MPDKTSAKRSAYMEACKLLYYENEFTANLLPKPRSIDDYQCPFLESLSKGAQEEKLTTSFKVGSRSRVQPYAKQVGVFQIRANHGKSHQTFVLFTIFCKLISISMFQIPKTSESEIIVSDVATCLYEVKIKIQNYTGDERVEKLYDFKERGHTFGIVTNTKLDDVSHLHIIILAGFIGKGSSYSCFQVLACVSSYWFVFISAS